MKKSSIYIIIALVLFFLTLVTYRKPNVATLIFGFGAMIMILLSQNARRNENRPTKNSTSPESSMQVKNMSVSPNNKHNFPKKTTTSHISSSTSTYDKQLIETIMSTNHAVYREEAISFLSVLDTCAFTNDKLVKLGLFDEFIRPIATSNDPMHASMVCGFFCGYFGGEIHLSDAEVKNLSNKYGDMIKQKIIENGGIFPKTN